MVFDETLQLPESEISGAIIFLVHGVVDIVIYAAIVGNGHRMLSIFEELIVVGNELGSYGFASSYTRRDTAISNRSLFLRKASFAGGCSSSS